MYDLIGDIHGHADELVQLLELLGYKRRNGVYKHADRRAVFVGDFIDRGPRIREVLHVVRAMCEAECALAVMGNHEFNALTYHTPDPKNPEGYLREHSEKNAMQHRETMAQLPERELKSYLEWFRCLPMWLDVDGVRVVHACWDNAAMRVIERALREHNGVTTPFLQAATNKSSSLFQAIEDVLKGKELELPQGMKYRDNDGHDRSHIRIRWFESPAGRKIRDYALPTANGISDESIPELPAERVRPYAPSEPPVFFGHYWLNASRPTVLASNIACLDFSVAKHGMLCAYRWDGERELTNDKFVSVPAMT